MRGIFLQVVGTLMGTAFPTAVTPRAAHAAESTPLQLEAKIPLGDVEGRLDHMAVDLARQHLFAAEFGNDSVGIVDLGASKVSGRIRGLKPNARTFRLTAHLPTAPGACTALFVPELDNLFLAVRASDEEPAAICVYRPDS